MHRFRHTAVLLAALIALAALPVAAVAQSAGQEQYTDPLGGGGGSAGGGSSGGGSSSGNGSSGSGSGGGGGGSVQPAQSQAPPAQPAQANPNELPRTGIPVALLAVSGGVLLASGAALRRRTR